jgi:hypothetical protein
MDGSAVSSSQNIFAPVIDEVELEDDREMRVSLLLRWISLAKFTALNIYYVCRLTHPGKLAVTAPVDIIVEKAPCFKRKIITLG